MSDARYCKNCKNINCPENRINCKYPDAIACDLYRDTPQTVFHQIAASPDVLAEKLVYVDGSQRVFNTLWRSTILPGKYWKTQAEAIAATVAKLKEVCNE